MHFWPSLLNLRNFAKFRALPNPPPPLLLILFEFPAVPPPSLYNTQSGRTNHREIAASDNSQLAHFDGAIISLVGRGAFIVPF